MNGKVVRLTTDKGFGFIHGSDQRDYFFHRSSVRNTTFEELRIGQDVEFEESEGPKGPRAEDVQAL